MEIILFLIAIIVVSVLITWLVVKGSKKLKTLKHIKFNLPKIPKIKFPQFNFTRKPKTTLTILNSHTTQYDNIFQEDLEIEYENGEYKRTTKKSNSNNSGFSFHKNMWVMMIGICVIGILAFYFMKHRKIKK